MPFQAVEVAVIATVEVVENHMATNVGQVLQKAVDNDKVVESRLG